MRWFSRDEQFTPLVACLGPSSSFDGPCWSLNRLRLVWIDLSRLEHMDRQSIKELVGDDERRLARVSWHELVVLRPNDFEVSRMLADTLPTKFCFRHRIVAAKELVLCLP